MTQYCAIPHVLTVSQRIYLRDGFIIKIQQSEHISERYIEPLVAAIVASTLVDMVTLDISKQ